MVRSTISLNSSVTPQFASNSNPKIYKSVFEPLCAYILTLHTHTHTRTHIHTPTVPPVILIYLQLPQMYLSWT